MIKVALWIAVLVLALVILKGKERYTCTNTDSGDTVPDGTNFVSKLTRTSKDCYNRSPMYAGKTKKCPNPSSCTSSA